MCGIGGIFSFSDKPISGLPHQLDVMNHIQQHRGPDDHSFWIHPNHHLGFAHQRLSIIDLENGRQPMSDALGHTVCYNGEIYNYLELKQECADYPFQTTSDTEVILAAYYKWGERCVDHFRGMFAFALWDENKQRLFCARDRFGIKPFYYARVGSKLFFASEMKTLLPFLPDLETDLDALSDYLAFQFCLGEQTLFKGVQQLMPAHTLTIQRGSLAVRKYWEVHYTLDFDHTPKYFHEKLHGLLSDSVALHTRSDVPIGAYISGGVDSAIVASLAAEKGARLVSFNGRFCEGNHYDESGYARAQAKKIGISLFETVMTSADFVDTIDKVIYHLDQPVAGPGSFAQYHVSRLAAEKCKVVLGGQGGDEIFGGYTRYLIAYFEQCIKAAIDGNSKNGRFIVTYESIIPQLCALKNYKPLLKEFWKEGLFDSLDKRYFRLIYRGKTLSDEINWDQLPGGHDPFKRFQNIFHANNVDKESYFDSMTHFDFKTLLPALLHVEDRMGMAHGLESRVPLVDHRVVEFAATMPSNIKFENGKMKRVLLEAMNREICQEIRSRDDKMGFPVPLTEWAQGELKDFIHDIFRSERVKQRPYMNQKALLRNLNNEGQFGRKLWGLLSLELWHRNFHDRHETFKNMVKDQAQLAHT